MTDQWYAGGGIGLGPRPEPPAPEPYPAPEITSADGAPVPVKTAVLDMERLARSFGWAVLFTYARGRFPHAATGRPGPVKDSLAVRMERGREFAVAVYVGGSTWSWDTLSILRAGRIERYPAVGAFLDALLGPVHGTARWYPPYVRSW